MLLDVVRIDLGHDQRGVGVHAEGRGVIHDDGTGGDGGGGELFTSASAGTEEGDVHAVEAVRGKFFDLVGLTLELDGLADGPVGGEHFDLADGEVSLGQDF